MAADFLRDMRRELFQFILADELLMPGNLAQLRLERFRNFLIAATHLFRAGDVSLHQPPVSPEVFDSTLFHKVG